MTEFLKKWKPAVSKGWLYGAAGLMWSAVGIFLNSLAYGWLEPLKWTRSLPLVLVGVALAYSIYYFGFSNLADKNIQRIQVIRSEKVCFFAFQQWHSYPLVAFMVSLGIFLRVYSPIPKPYLALMYIGIGGGLFLASFHYYGHLTRGYRIGLTEM